jgi:hypothetical protein
LGRNSPPKAWHVVMTTQSVKEGKRQNISFLDSALVYAKGVGKRLCKYRWHSQVPFNVAKKQVLIQV